MHIVHVSAELAPYAKVGGLGEALFGLLTSFKTLGQDLTVIIPKYRLIPEKHLSTFKKECTIIVDEDRHSYENTIWSSTVSGYKVVLIEPTHPKSYFDRDHVYGYEDDLFRFLYFSKVALQYLSLQDGSIDILHLHDWHTSLMAPLYKDTYSKMGSFIKKIVLNIHNLAFQGFCKPWDLERFGIDGYYYLQENRMLDDQNKENLNLLKGGLNYSDGIVVVSKNYAKEILKQENGFGLHNTLIAQEQKINGILNGIDTTFWNPQNDPYISFHYDHSMKGKNIQQQKEKNKQVLQKRLNLSNSSLPLISYVGRLTEQKGLKLIESALHFAQEKQYQFIILGSASEEKVTNHFKELKEKLKDNKNIHLHLGYDESLAHELYSSSDFLIIPSLFEPCGLVQMIALRYGTIPIARKTGGLADTVFDVDDLAIALDKRNGYTFNEFTESALNLAISRALDTLQNNPKKHLSIISTGIQIDFSWDLATKHYLALYQRLLKEKI